MNVQLSKTNIRNIRQGRTTQISADQLGHGEHKLHLKPRKMHRVESALRNRKGLRILLENDEAEATLHGSGLPGIRTLLHHGARVALPAVQRGIRKYGQRAVGRRASNLIAEAADSGLHHAIDAVGDVTGAYGIAAHGGSIRNDLRRFHRAIKPALRSGIKAVGQAAASYVAPGFGQFTAPLVDRAVDRVGDVTGAFGLAPRRPRGRPRKNPLVVGGSFLPAGY